MCLAFWGNLADQYVPCFYFSATSDNPAFIQILQCLLSHIRDVPGDLFVAEFCVPGDRVKLFDMNRGKYSVFDQTFTHKYRIFKIVSAPWHKRNHHVLSEREFTEFSGRSVGNDVSFLNQITLFDNRFLIEAGILIRPAELGQFVNLNPCGGIVHTCIRADYYSGCVHINDFAVFPCGNRDS